MSTRRKDSEWRAQRFGWHGQAVLNHLQKNFEPGDTFTVREVAEGAKCLQRLSDRYAYDVAIAVCSELYNRKILNRQGNTYLFPETRRKAA